MKTCINCNQPTEKTIRQRCNTCYQYWLRNGRDRTRIRAKKQRIEICENCGIAPTGRQYARLCTACGEYAYIHGKPRPSCYWQPACIVCGQPRTKGTAPDKFVRGRCNSCNGYYRTRGYDRSPKLIKRRVPFGWCDCGQPASRIETVHANGENRNIAYCAECHQRQEDARMFIVKRIDYATTIGLLVHGIAAHAIHQKSPSKQTRLYDIALKLNDIEKEIAKHGFTGLLSQPFPAGKPLEDTDEDGEDADGIEGIDGMEIEPITTAPDAQALTPAAPPRTETLLQADRLRAFIGANPGHTITELAALTNIPRPTVDYYVRITAGLGILEKRTPPGKARPQYIYLKGTDPCQTQPQTPPADSFAAPPIG